MHFNMTNDKANANPSPEYEDRRYGTKLPPVTAKGNLNYLEFIDLVKILWTKGHPDVLFMPLAGKQSFNPEVGYIIYNLQHRVPAKDHAKPRVHHIADSPSDDTKKLLVYVQNFKSIVQFTAVHQDPRVAEEIIEEFENFMIESMPVLIEFGIEDLFYDHRQKDGHETRFSEDVSTRSITYMLGTQKILTVEVEKLQQVIMDIRMAVLEQATPVTNTDNDSFVVNVRDTFTSDFEVNPSELISPSTTLFP